MRLLSSARSGRSPSRRWPTEAGVPCRVRTQLPTRKSPYEVQSGETLQMILYRERGVLSDQGTLRAPQNELLFKIRSPSMLRPGDHVHLPKQASRGTQVEPLRIEEVNRFCVVGRHRPLRLKLTRKGQPLRNVEYTLEAAQTRVTGTTDGKGILWAKVPLEARQGQLEVEGQVRKLVLGGLDPAHTVTGIQARLNNLGFHAGLVDGVVGPITRRAIRKFQASCGLRIDGIVGPKTRGALVEAYGM